jgi:hypothetical protein
MPTHLHAILFDIKFNSDRLKHTLDDMRKFTGRRLLDHATLHLPKIYMQVFQDNAGKDRQHRFWQPTQHPVGIMNESFCSAEVFDPVEAIDRRSELAWGFS